MESSSKEFLKAVFNGDTIITILLAAFLVFVVVLVIMALKVKKHNQKETESGSKGKYLNRSIATFMPLGYAISIPLGIVTRNVAIAVALGPALGLALGIIIGSQKEKKHGGELRPLNQRELKLKETGQYMLTGLILLAVILYIITYYVVN